ncbi:hypothetical protein DFJ73DRAFT_837864 [Zopfochytrium polystomum]|nr:hypothetical protein DFJ73DRAFT_837864 [Zopfochytrium polystomum]
MLADPDMSTSSDRMDDLDSDATPTKTGQSPNKRATGLDDSAVDASSEADQPASDLSTPVAPQRRSARIRASAKSTPSKAPKGATAGSSESPSQSEDEDNDGADFPDPRRKSKKPAAPLSNTSPKRPRGRPKKAQTAHDAEVEEAADAEAGETAEKRAKKTPRKLTAKKKVDEAERSGNEEEGDDAAGLYAVLLKGGSIPTAVSEWIEEYNNSPEDSLVELINFIIDCCGAKGTIEKEAVMDSDLVATSLEELQSKTELQDVYPLVAKKGTQKRSNRFRSSLIDFWKVWYKKFRSSPHGDGMFTASESETVTLFETVKMWLFTLSSSAFRPFRHTATVIALVLHTCLCDTAKEVHSDWNTANRQLTTLRSSGAPKTQRQDKLEKDVMNLFEKKALLENHMTDFFDSVFVHRYRDTDPLVRTECMRELGVWIMKFPDLYLDASYLRYVGWMLSDKNPSVRLESLRTLVSLFSSPSHLAGLRQFAERFKPRLIEIATREIHGATRSTAIELMARLSEAGFIDDSDRLLILPPLVFSVDAHYRTLAGPMAAEMWTTEYKEPALEDASANAKSGDAVQTAWVEAKSLARMLVELASATALKPAGPAAASGGGPEIEGFKDAPESILFDSLSQALSQARSSLSAVEKGSDDDIMDEEEEEVAKTQRPPDEFSELNDEMKETLLKRLQTCQEMADWCRDLEEVAEGSDIGAARIHAAMVSLFGRIEICEEIESIFEYLTCDLSAGSSSQLSQLSQVYELSDHEETCLLMILNSCIRLERSPPSDVHDDAAKARRAEKTDDPLKIDRLIVKFVPKLLKKYGSEFDGNGQRRLIEALKLLATLDIGVYLELRMLKSFETLLDELSELFLRHSNREVLREFRDVFGHLVGLTTKVEPTMQEEKRNKRVLAMEKRPGDEDSVASAAGLHKTASERIEDMADQCISMQLAPLRSKIKALADRKEKVPNDDLKQLRVVLSRLVSISAFFDLTTLKTSNFDKDVEESAESLVPTSLEETHDSPKTLSDVIYLVLEVGLILQLADPIAHATSNFHRVETLSETQVRSVESDILGSRYTNLILSDTIGLLANQALYEMANLLDAAKADGPDSVSEESLKAVAERVDRLIRVCEAMTANETEYGFSFGVRLQSVRVLADLMLAANGPFRSTFPSISLELKPETKPEIIDIWTTAVLCLGVPDNALTPQVVTWLKLTNPRLALASPYPALGLKASENVEAACLMLFRVLADIEMLVILGILPVVQVASIIGFYGLGSASASAQPQTEEAPTSQETLGGGVSSGLPVFGTVWDEQTKRLAKLAITDRVQKFFSGVVEESENLKPGETVDETVVDSLRAMIEEAGRVTAQTLQTSFDLYFVNRVQTTRPAEAVGRLLIECIQPWSKILELPAQPGRFDPDTAVYIQAVACRALLQMLRRLIEHVIAVAAAAASAEDEESPSSFEFQGVLVGSRLQRSLRDVNGAWRVLGAVGGLVKQILTTFSVEFEPRPGDEGIATIDDLLDFASRKMTAANLKPVEDDEVWDAFWVFNAALKKGDAKMKRQPTKRKRAETSKAARTPRKRQKQTKKAAVSRETVDEDDGGGPDGEEAERKVEVAGKPKRGRPPKSTTKPGSAKAPLAEKKPPPAPTRRSTRSTKAKLKNFAESEDEEEDDEERQPDEDTSPVRNRGTSSRAAAAGKAESTPTLAKKKPTPAPRREDEDDEESEEEPLVPTKFRDKLQAARDETSSNGHAPAALPSDSLVFSPPRKKGAAARTQLSSEPSSDTSAPSRKRKSRDVAPTSEGGESVERGDDAEEDGDEEEEEGDDDRDSSSLVEVQVRPVKRVRL